MAVQVADAFIPLVLDLATFDQQVASVEARIDALQSRIAGLQSMASSISIPSSASLDISGMIGSATNAATGAAGAGGVTIGNALMTGGIEGVAQGAPALAQAVSSAVDSAIAAGKQAAEIASPSARGDREIGGPIMAGVAMGITRGTPGVMAALTSSIGYAFHSWKARSFGGTFIASSGVNNVTNPGGIGGWGLMDAIAAGIDQANPTGPGELSRSILGQFPRAQASGQRLLEGLMGAILPSWAAGPMSDLVGTFFGTKPIMTAEQALSPAVSADAGGFADHPYGGGYYTFNNTFYSTGNFTDVEREVQMGILESMRRLGIY
jgi:hypothetical protein